MSLHPFHVFVLGYPGGMGGANTECWHTVKLWREAGWDVTLVPTWKPNDLFRSRLDAIGARTVVVDGPHALADVPDLPGAAVVGFCNSHYINSVASLRALGCRLVWVNCMTFCYANELNAAGDYGLMDAYVFQSDFQRGRIEASLARFGYDPFRHSYLIRGAFDLAEFPFRPRAHAEGEEFVIGRLSRPDADKWSSNTWPIYAGVPYKHRRALVMGWNSALQRKLGPPPRWATALEPQEISSREFLGRCHLLMPINGGAKENWPRVGLEAMASGVPIVAQNEWGWREMIDHGTTGFLGSDAGGGNDEELKFYAALLAHDETLRMQIAEAARARVEQLADPGPITDDWNRLFETVAGDRLLDDMLLEPVCTSSGDATL